MDQSTVLLTCVRIAIYMTEHADIPRWYTTELAKPFGMDANTVQFVLQAHPDIFACSGVDGHDMYYLQDVVYEIEYWTDKDEANIPR